MRTLIFFLFIWVSVSQAQLLTTSFAREQLGELGYEFMKDGASREAQYFVEAQGFREERQYTVGYKDAALKKYWLAIPYRASFDKIGYLFYYRDETKPSGRFFFAVFEELGAGVIRIMQEDEIVNHRSIDARVVTSWFDCIKQNITASCSAKSPEYLKCILERSGVLKNCTLGFLFAQ